jgi:hypothetical protein
MRRDLRHRRLQVELGRRGLQFGDQGLGAGPGERRQIAVQFLLAKGLERGRIADRPPRRCHVKGIDQERPQKARHIGHRPRRRHAAHAVPRHGQMRRVDLRLCDKGRVMQVERGIARILDGMVKEKAPGCPSCPGNAASAHSTRPAAPPAPGQGSAHCPESHGAAAAWDAAPCPPPHRSPH